MFVLWATLVIPEEKFTFFLVPVLSAGRTEVRVSYKAARLEWEEFQHQTDL